MGDYVSLSHPERPILNSSYATELIRQRDWHMDHDHALTGFAAWYRNGVNALLPMSVEQTTVTDGVIWQHAVTASGQVADIHRADGHFWKIEGVKITKYKPDGSVFFSWNQPDISIETGPVTIPAADGESTVIQTTGVVGVITDTDRHMLLSLDQEPFSPFEKFAVVRPPIQASAAKWRGVVEEGNSALDKQLSTLLPFLTPDGDIKKVITDATQVVLAPYGDSNKYGSSNILLYFHPVDVSDPKHDLLASDGRRWCSQEEYEFVTSAGLTNGHGVAAIANYILRSART